MLPGGSANVFARSLGLPNNPVEATGAVLEAIREGRRRTVNLGLAVWDDGDGDGDGDEGTADGLGDTAWPASDLDGPPGRRYFTFCAGIGYDAEVVRAVEGLRGAGYKASPSRYVHTALRHYFMTDRRHPALRVERPRRPPVDGIFMTIISNTAPWTYAGDRPINPTPWAGFDTGLDLLGLRRHGRGRRCSVCCVRSPASGSACRGARHLIHAHDEDELAVSARRPMAFQLDGDYLGERERVTFRSVPAALQVLV